MLARNLTIPITMLVFSFLETQRIFLQYLFMKERKYSIDYTKWIGEQCSKILQMPSLYQELASTINGITLNRESITEKATLLEKLFLKYEQNAKRR